MHEAAIAQSIIRTVLKEAAQQEAVRVESVDIDVGEWTFLNTEQVDFWVKTGFGKTVAEHAVLRFTRIDAQIRCRQCGHQGRVASSKTPADHRFFPLLSCPSCSSADVDIVRGKELTIRRISILKNSPSC